MRNHSLTHDFFRPTEKLEITIREVMQTYTIILLEKINESNPIVKAVIVSAYGDMDNIRTAMNRGAFDFICKPVNFDDLETTLKKTMSYVSQLKQTLQAIK